MTFVLVFRCTSCPPSYLLVRITIASSVQVSDGVIAPGYQPDALAILEKKRSGSYCVLQMDPDYSPSDMETRTLFGLKLEQLRNNATINADTFSNIVTDQKSVRSLSPFFFY